MALPATTIFCLAILVFPSAAGAQQAGQPLDVIILYETDGPGAPKSSCLPKRVEKPTQPVSHVAPTITQAPTQVSTPPMVLPPLSADVQGDEGPFPPPSPEIQCCPCEEPAPRHALFIFGGIFSRGSMGDTVTGFWVPYDGNYIGGLGYQIYPWTKGSFHFGGELGVAIRSGEGTTVEAWGGPTVRHEGWVFRDWLRIAPSLTAGISGVTNAMAVEIEREENWNGDGNVLFYLGPEIAFSKASNPDFEVFYRLHHRSGASGLLGELREGYNANLLGLRWRY